MKNKFDFDSGFMLYLGKIAGQKAINKFVSCCFVDHHLDWKETVSWLEGEGHIEHWCDMFFEFVSKDFFHPLFEEIEL